MGTRITCWPAICARSRAEEGGSRSLQMSAVRGGDLRRERKSCSPGLLPAWLHALTRCLVSSHSPRVNGGNLAHCVSLPRARAGRTRGVAFACPAARPSFSSPSWALARPAVETWRLTEARPRRSRPVGQPTKGLGAALLSLLVMSLGPRPRLRPRSQLDPVRRRASLG